MQLFWNDNDHICKRMGVFPVYTDSHNWFVNLCFCQHITPISYSKVLCHFRLHLHSIDIWSIRNIIKIKWHDNRCDVSIVIKDAAFYIYPPRQWTGAALVNSGLIKAIFLAFVNHDLCISSGFVSSWYNFSPVLKQFGSRRRHHPGSAKYCNISFNCYLHTFVYHNPVQMSADIWKLSRGYIKSSEKVLKSKWLC